MVISNHFLCKDLLHHPIETTIYKWLFGVPGTFGDDEYLGWKISKVQTALFQGPGRLSEELCSVIRAVGSDHPGIWT